MTRIIVIVVIVHNIDNTMYNEANGNTINRGCSNNTT